MSERPQIQNRKDWISIMAKAPAARVLALMPDLSPHEILRAPEIGTIMVQGRTGGTGAPFNLGEMSVTRASLRLACGEVGHAYVQGRDKGHALRAVLLDALMQSPKAPEVKAAILTPLRQEAEARKAERAAKAAATRVEFFTLVRGEDK